MKNSISLCPVCDTIIEYIFSKIVLYKYNVKYYKCIQCGLVSTEKPYWMDEAYTEAVSSLDVGIVKRNIDLSFAIEELLNKNFDTEGEFLDFAGGYGLFVRIMRDKGFNFYRYDKYCSNIFAKYFDISNIDNEIQKQRFELVTAFEFLEHVDNPVFEIKKMFNITNSVIITTHLIPPDIQENSDWWYFVPESGQHITFYTIKSLSIIAKKLGVNFYSDRKTIHIFTRRKLKMIFQRKDIWGALISILTKKRKKKCVSIKNDFNHIKNILLESNRRVSNE